jgi:O-antigen ligase
LRKYNETLLAFSEPLIILGLIFAFWFHSPPIRDNLVGLLWLALPVFRLRLLVVNRVWTETLLNDLLLIFILLTAINFTFAPYQRSNYLVLMSRPFLGIWMYLYALEHARMFKLLHWLAFATVGMGIVMGLISLTTSQWAVDKADELVFLFDALPRFDWQNAGQQIQLPANYTLHDVISNMLLAFNVNEVAGALSFMVPVTAALAVGIPDHTEKVDRPWLIMRVIAGIAFALLLFSLFLGQSRFAIMGTIVALFIVIWTLIPKWRWRGIALGALALFTIIQIGLVLNLFTSVSDTGISDRDQNTIAVRFDLWNTSLRMMRDYPLTGIGMSMFRGVVQREEYAIPYYQELGYPPPHAHNEWLQMGVDLGIPGFVLYIAWQVAVVWMLWQGWRSANDYARIVAMAVFAGLLAHAVYGIGDAVTLWDRFSFVLWWLVGLAGAQYVLIRGEQEADVADVKIEPGWGNASATNENQTL